MTPQTPDTKAQAARENSIAHAERDLEHATRLLSADHWECYFVRRLRERRAGYAIQLEDDISEAKSIELRNRIREIDGILRIPAEDYSVHAATIARARK